MMTHVQNGFFHYSIAAPVYSNQLRPFRLLTRCRPPELGRFFPPRGEIADSKCASVTNAKRGITNRVDRTKQSYNPGVRDLMKMLSVILLVSGVSVWAQALAADVESEEAVSKIIPLMYVSASDVAATLNSLGK